MFSNRDVTVKLVYRRFGAVMAIIGMLFGIGMLSPVTAQRDKFGDIQCISFRVVDADGTVGIVLGIDRHGGVVGVRDKDGKSAARLDIGEHGGVVSKHGKDGESGVDLSIDDHGGRVLVSDKFGLLKFLD